MSKIKKNSNSNTLGKYIPEQFLNYKSTNSVEVDSIERLKHSLNVPDGEADFWEKINSGEWEDNKWEDGSSTTNSNVERYTTFDELIK